MTTVDLMTVRLCWAEEDPLRPAPYQLRGAIARRFPNNTLLHQHDGERVLYRYPTIQYRWDREGPLLLGLGDGATFLAGVDWAGMELQIGDRAVTVRRSSFFPSARNPAFESVATLSIRCAVVAALARELPALRLDEAW